MPEYIVSAHTARGFQTQACNGAAMAHAWVEEFRDRGARVVVVTRDGFAIALHDLPARMREEATAVKGGG